jgi:hypothetical protein
MALPVVGLAGGGDVILVPEIPYSIKNIGNTILERLKKGKPYSIVVVAEGIQTDGRKRAAEYIAQEIEYETGIETRETVLGYIQRGGSPTPFDRNLSTIILHFTGKQRTYIPTYHRRIYSTDILSDIFPPVIESVYLHGKSLPNPDFHSEVCFIFLFRLDPLRRKTTLCQSSCRRSTYENIFLSGTIELFVHILLEYRLELLMNLIRILVLEGLMVILL